MQSPETAEDFFSRFSPNFLLMSSAEKKIAYGHYNTAMGFHYYVKILQFSSNNMVL